MRDASPSDHPPRDWHDAFAALPLETAPAGGWSRVAARLDSRRRAHWPLWAASAAAVVLAIALPWQLQLRQGGDAALPDMAATVDVRNDDPLEPLYAESAQLESLLALARDERVSSGAAAVFAGELDAQLASIDVALMQSGLSPGERQSLWRQRVDSLRTLASFESNRRWLAAQGAHYDGALVAID